MIAEQSGAASKRGANGGKDQTMRTLVRDTVGRAGNGVVCRSTAVCGREKKSLEVGASRETASSDG